MRRIHPTLKEKVAQKRQFCDSSEMDDDFDGTDVPVEDAASKVADAQSKRKRKREKEKANKQANPPKKAKASEDEDEDGGVRLPKAKPKQKPSKTVTEKDDGSVNEDIGNMAPSMMADYVGQRLKFWESSLSSVELEDKYIPERVFQDTTSWDKQRILPNLPNYMEKCCRVEGKNKFRLDSASETKGAPHTLIISAAALRSSHVATAIRKYQSKNAMAAKLFAKHFKLKESIEICENNRLGIAVGTPGRILDLLKEDALKVSDLRWIILDASHIDKKSFGVFDIRDTHKALMDFLGHEKIKARFDEGTKILFF